MSKLMIIPEKPCYIAGAAALPLSASEPDYKPVITDANLRRRMGRLLKMSVYCGWYSDVYGDGLHERYRLFRQQYL